MTNTCSNEEPENKQDDETKSKATTNNDQAKITESLIREMNKKHAVVNIGGKCRVMTEQMDPDTNLPDIILSSPSDFKSFYSNKKIETANGGEITYGHLWFKDPMRREYVGITFNPRVTPAGYYNLWSGFSVKPKKGDCSLYLEHIKTNIAQGNSAIYDYIIAWMAHGVQCPDDLFGTALVLRGSMGTGKGVFANGYGRLFGRHFLPLSQSSQLTGKFNAHMKDKLLVFADESFWAGDKQAEGVLKSLITEPFLVIEGKGENAYKIKNHLHFIFATNNDWCVPAGPQERRFFVLDVGEKHMQDHAYFGAIQKELDSGGSEALLYFLMHYEIGETNLRKFPQTDALLEQKIFSMSPVQKFWYSRIQSGALSSNKSGWDAEIPKEWLYADFIKFCNDLGVRHKPSNSEFGIQLKKLIPGLAHSRSSVGKYGNSRKNVYRLSSLDECRAAFCKMLNYNISWPTDVDSIAQDLQEVLDSKDSLQIEPID